MNKYCNIDLSKKTTFKIGGIAKNFYIPDSIEELKKLINTLKHQKYYIISGGSNLLINDQKTFENVISMENVDKSIENKNNGNFYIGASNRIQDVINHINKNGYGGIEELFSLPAMFGGIIYMNAGIGSQLNPLFTIADFITKVKVINRENLQIEWIEQKDCNFKHRYSKFHNNKYIILGAECKFYKQTLEESKIKIKNRIKHCKEKQEWGKGCFGTCFSVANRKLLKVQSLINHKKQGVYQSKINSNWLVNSGNGTYNDAIKIINKAKKLHKIFKKNIKCEVIIWE